MLAARTLVRLFAVAQALFRLAWWFAYRWLPEGVLRGGTGASALPLERLSFWPRLLGIIAWNTLAAGLLVAGANRLQVRRLPLGFVPPLAYWLLYGLLLGSNSFATPLPARPAPSLALALQRSGLLELTAYLLVAAATARWARWRQEGWLWGPVRPLSPAPLGAGERGMLVAAAGLLIAAAARETLMWCAAAGGC